MSMAYEEGFLEGKAVAQGFHKGTMNDRERKTRRLSPFMKSVQPEKDADWKKGFIAGYESYMRNVPSIEPAGITL